MLVGVCTRQYSMYGDPHCPHIYFVILGDGTLPTNMCCQLWWGKRGRQGCVDNLSCSSSSSTSETANGTSCGPWLLQRLMMPASLLHSQVDECTVPMWFTHLHNLQAEGWLLPPILGAVHRWLHNAAARCSATLTLCSSAGAAPVHQLDRHMGGESCHYDIYGLDLTVKDSVHLVQLIQSLHTNNASCQGKPHPAAA